MTTQKLHKGKVMYLKKIILLLSCFLAVVVCFNPCYLASANSLPSIENYSSDRVYESSSLKNGKVNELEALPLEKWHRVPSEMPTEAQLLKLSKRLRDVARYLGSTWPVTIPINPLETANDDVAEGRSSWKIVEFRPVGETWKTIAVGQVLGFVTQELQILKSSQAQPLIDFRLSREGSDRDRLLTDVPLSRYCYEILRSFH